MVLGCRESVASLSEVVESACTAGRSALFDNASAKLLDLDEGIRIEADRL